jgi:hypothetical protein
MSEDPASYTAHRAAREPTTRLQFVLPAKQADALQRAASANGVTISQVLRWAVDDFLAAQ